ncbi:MAG: BON domain-containing protein [bacterium]|nr:BON domain-containing protein [bacterium]
MAWRLTVLIVAAAALALWVGYTLATQPSRIEEALRVETSQVLVLAGLGGVEPELDGREAVLRGSVASVELRNAAERVTAGIDGVRSVENLLEVASAAAPEPVPRYLEIRSRPDSVTLRGSVSSETLRRQIVERATALYGAEGVDDRLVVDESIETGVGPDSAVEILGALADLEQELRLHVEADHVRLSGTVGSDEDRRRIQQRVLEAANRVPSVFNELEVLERQEAVEPNEAREER